MLSVWLRDHRKDVEAADIVKYLFYWRVTFAGNWNYILFDRIASKDVVHFSSFSHVSLHNTDDSKEILSTKS